MKRKMVSVIGALVFIGAFFPVRAFAAGPGGYFEFNLHYSKWSVNIAKSIISDLLNNAVETRFRENFLEEFKKEHPNIQETSYSQELAFDSGGDNFGFEVRLYPGGEDGSFSLGLAVEKTTMRFTLTELKGTLEVRDVFTGQTGTLQGKAGGSIVVKPLSFHLSFRWDIVPSSRVHPYITFGVGASTAKAIDEFLLTYTYSGSMDFAGEKDTFTGSGQKTGKELKEELEKEGDKLPLNFIPFVQLNLGLKGVITSNLHFLVDAGIWNGFLLRGGLSFRF